MVIAQVTPIGNHKQKNERSLNVKTEGKYHMKRWKMKKRKSRKLFTKTARSTHRKNVQKPRAMRGGYRL